MASRKDRQERQDSEVKTWIPLRLKTTAGLVNRMYRILIKQRFA